jgi:hypothetical protein
MFFRTILSGFIYSIRALILLRKDVDSEKIKEIAGIRDLSKARILAIIILCASIAGVIFTIYFIWYLFYM